MPNKDRIVRRIMLQCSLGLVLELKYLFCKQNFEFLTISLITLSYNLTCKVITLFR